MNEEPSFGRFIRERRRALDLTQEELARRVGCAAITVRKIEAEDARASVQIAERLAMALGIPLNERAAFVRRVRTGSLVGCFQPAVLAAENALELAPEQRRRTVYRIDGGAGSDEQLVWLLARNYQVIAKGTSNRRAEALSRQVARWDAYEDYWLGEVPTPIDYGRPVRVFVKRRCKDGVLRHSYYVSTLSLPSKGRFMAYYNERGAAEVEQFRTDKSGLNLTARRKHRFLAQKGYIMLTDLAHNLLADFYHRALVGSRFEGYGPKRIIRDLLQMPGKLTFVDGKIAKIELSSQKQFSQDLLMCLERYCLGS